MIAAVSFAACGEKGVNNPDDGQQSCQGQAVGPTAHSGSISASETWTKCGSPHVVTGMLDIRAAAGGATPTLTIEAGATVHMQDDAWFRVGFQSAGNVKIVGTSTDTVKFISPKASPAKGEWIGLQFMNMSSGSELHYATLSHCGGATAPTDPFEGCINASGVVGTPSSLTIVFDHVTIRNSGNSGAVFENSSAFGAGSTGLTVTDAVQNPVVIEAEELGSLPSGGMYTNNGQNSIMIAGGGSVQRTASWINPGIPYHAPALFLGSNSLIDVRGTASPTLTIAAGTTFRLGAEIRFRVGFQQPGKLIMPGTATQPIAIVSDKAAPAKGDYGGMLFGNEDTGSELRYVSMNHCGQASVSAACITVQGNAGQRASNTVLFDNVTISNSATMGVEVFANAAFTTGSTNLSVSSGNSYPVSIGTDEAFSLPAGGTYTGNTPNHIQLIDSDVTVSASWINAGIPYAKHFSGGSIDIDALTSTSPPPTLTLAAGTIIRMGEDTGIRIGKFFGGALIANGTATSAIVFTPDQTTPTPAFWVGIEVASQASSATKFNYVTVEYGGGFFGYVPGDEANILFAKDIGPVITNSIVRNSAECGIVRATFTSTWLGTDFMAAAHNNTFTGNALGAQCGPY